jgi:hypothetical protein
MTPDALREEIEREMRELSYEPLHEVLSWKAAVSVAYRLVMRERERAQAVTTRYIADQQPTDTKSALWEQPAAHADLAQRAHEGGAHPAANAQPSPAGGKQRVP